MTYRYLLLPLLLFLFGGCKEEYPVYAAFSEQHSTTFPKCLHYTMMNNADKRAVEQRFGLKDDKSCPYHAQLTKYYVGACDNPAVKSLGSDFNGYIRIEIKKGFKCYYKIQSDYKNDAEAAFERVLKKIETEKKRQRFSN
jgi:hypothetical protein